MKIARHKWKWSPACNGRATCKVCGLKTGVRSWLAEGKFRSEAWYKLPGSAKRLKKMPPCNAARCVVCSHCKGTGVVEDLSKVK